MCVLVQLIWDLVCGFEDFDLLVTDARPPGPMLEQPDAGQTKLQAANGASTE